MVKANSSETESIVDNHPVATPEWAIWCQLNNRSNQSKENHKDCEDRSEFFELEWFRREIVESDLVSLFDADLVAPSLEGIRGSASRGWKKKFRGLMTPTKPPAWIFLSTANRTDPIDEVATAMRARFPEARIVAILGEWWTGQRRTWPIAGEISLAHWYQCHDRVLPELMGPKASEVREIIANKLAVCVSMDSNTRQLWLDILPTLGMLPLAASDTRHLPEGEAEVVIYDPIGDFVERGFELPATDDFASLEGISLNIAKLRRSYPSSKIVVTFDFPRWSEVQAALKAGADIILGKPFDLDGFSRMLAHGHPRVEAEIR